MDKQKIFPTAMMGFEKNAVLDYIYEQDTLNKRREDELLKEIDDLKQQLDDQVSEISEEITPQEEDDSLPDDSNRMCELEDAVVVLHDSYDELKEKYEALVEENQSLTEKLEEKANKIEEFSGEIQPLRERVLQQRLQNEHLSAQLEYYKKSINSVSEKPIANCVASNKNADVKSYEVTVRQKREYTDLKEEIDDFRSSVTDTLLGFETALARLAAVDSNLDSNPHSTNKRYIGQLANHKD